MMLDHVAKGKRAHNFKDITGQIFGRLTVIEDGIYIRGNTNCMCECECGVIKLIRKSSLKSGYTKSCGCLAKEVVGVCNITHKLSKHPLYDTWLLMRRRCHDPNHKNFDTYGKRGIFVCVRWMFSVENFIADMGCRPSKKHTLDRINNKHGYSKQNCRWATQTEQMRNTCKNRLIEFNGKRQCLASWCEELSIKYSRTNDRLNKLGWSVDRAFNTPKLRCGGINV